MSIKNPYLKSGTGAQIFYEGVKASNEDWIEELELHYRDILGNIHISKAMWEERKKEINQ